LDKKELKYKTLICGLLLICILAGCNTGSGNVKVYDGDNAGVDVTHEEKSMTAVVSSVDVAAKTISFVDCASGAEKELLYNGGVTLENSYGNDIDFSELGCGEIMDVTYYTDNSKLVSAIGNSNVEKRTGVSKFSFSADESSATYKGVECSVSKYVTAYDENNRIDILEISKEDELTLYFYGGKLMSIVVDVGHGYVSLENQTTYIGGMVEIGYDVIVPVTSNMLLEVREGTYTLRISKNGYSDSMEDIVVTKGEKTDVDLLEIAIPRGTAVFNIEPSDAVLYVNGDEQPSHTYANIYGDYTIKVEAEGYDTFKGKFTINDTVKEFNVTMTATEDDEEDEDTEDSEETEETSETTSTTATGSTEATTTEAVTTNNTVTISTPEGAGVYVDGEYVGVAPVTFAKTVGSHTITLYKTGYLIKSYTIQSLDDGNDDTYTLADLVKITGDAEEADKSE
jgi:hypothetical protein